MMSTTELIALILTPTLVYSIPSVLTLLGGTSSERSGIVNVGLEGIMVVGAFSSIIFGLAMSPSLGSMTPWIAILVGGVIGILSSLIHIVATAGLYTDHIISGIVINLMVPVLGVFLIKARYRKGQTDNITRNLEYSFFPGLAGILIIGPIFFKNTLLPAYCAILIAVIAWAIIFKTEFGLCLRSVDENPQATDTLGIDVYVIRYPDVLISGLLGGTGGAVFARSILGNFSAGAIVGQGFTSVTAMVSGKWNPLGAMGASLFPGFTQSLGTIGAQLPVISSIPPVLLQIASYLLTIIVLVVFPGRASEPKANEKSYIKSK